MSNDHALRRPRWVAAWVLLSMFGFALGFLSVFIGGYALVDALTGDAAAILDDVGWGFYLQLTLGFALGGAGATAGQWALLRRHVPDSGRWILGGFVGFGVVAVLYLLLFDRVPIVANELVHNLAGGAMVGFVQLPVVRRLTGRSWQWPALTAAVMVLAGAIAGLLRGLGVGDDLSGPLGVAGLAIVTGIVLSGWMVRAREGSAATEVRSSVQEQ